MWSFRTPGAGPDDFPAMLAAMRTTGSLANQPEAAKFLFALRWKIGALLGWDDPSSGVGSPRSATGCPPTSATPRAARTAPECH
ncbi:hypothetical protein GCM10017786_24950 [Amycolatopsis deserti]|uniref:Transposase n=1 Tax=Amycolatopsis deserti TaxID=185696 RepID=A0ABQ3ISC1_9PSEU|nr:hypothetical protein GCM10017786_24950 [Amycolatopsis deserti]